MTRAAPLALPRVPLVHAGACSTGGGRAAQPRLCADRVRLPAWGFLLALALLAGCTIRIDHVEHLTVRRADVLAPTDKVDVRYGAVFAPTGKVDVDSEATVVQERSF